MSGNQRTIVIDCRSITDRDSFHGVFAKALAFPDFYGRNMDAWIDCMTNLDTDFSGVQIAPGDIVVLELHHAQSLKDAAPGLWTTLLDCAASSIPAGSRLASPRSWR